VMTSLSSHRRSQVDMASKTIELHLVSINQLGKAPKLMSLQASSDQLRR